MVDIEKIENRYRHSSPINDFKSTAGAFARDLFELAELQAKLLKADSQLAMRQSIGSVTAIVISSCCLLGCLPVLFLGLASAFSYCFAIDVWLAQLTIGISFSVLSLITATFAFRNLAGVHERFKRSIDEFSKTFAWIKQVVKEDSTQ